MITGSDTSEVGSFAMHNRPPLETGSRFVLLKISLTHAMDYSNKILTSGRLSDLKKESPQANRENKESETTSRLRSVRHCVGERGPRSW